MGVYSFLSLSPCSTCSSVDSLDAFFSCFAALAAATTRLGSLTGSPSLECLIPDCWRKEAQTMSGRVSFVSLYCASSLIRTAKLLFSMPAVWLEGSLPAGDFC